MIESTVHRIRTRRARIAADPELAELELRAVDEDDEGAAVELLERLGIARIAGADGADDDDEEEDDEEDDDEEEEDDDEPISKAEAERLRKRADEQEARARKAEKKLADERRNKDESEGDFERLYKEEKRKNESLEKAIEDGERSRSAEAIARRLKFRNPAHAVRLISAEAMESESSQERALKALAREEPSYVRKAQREPDGGGDDDRGSSSSSSTNGNGNGAGDGKGEKTFGMDTIRAAYAESGDGGEDD